MLLEIADWKFEVDVSATSERTTRYSFDHCECGYCKNFYETVDDAHPYLRESLLKFGVHLEGPCELMPFEPTLLLACYRVDGNIVQWGRSALAIRDIPVVPESGDDDTFLLWVGEMAVPWIQDCSVEDVVSPANLPEFMDRMRNIWMMRHEDELLFS